MPGDRKEDEVLKRSPAEVPTPGLAGPEGSSLDERRAGTPGDPGVPDAATDAAAARRRMAGDPHGPTRGGLSGGALPSMVSGSMREGKERGSDAGIPEAALPLTEEGQYRD